MKQLQNNFTTTEQSKQLLELGVPRWTADEYRNKNGYGNRYSLERIRDVELLFQQFSEYTPCWSTCRLMEIFDICYNGEYHDNLILSMWMNINAVILALSDKECIDFSKLRE